MNFSLTNIKDLDILILSLLPDADLASMLCLNKYFHDLGTLPELWRFKILRLHDSQRIDVSRNNYKFTYLQHIFSKRNRDLYDPYPFSY